MADEDEQRGSGNLGAALAAAARDPFAWLVAAVLALWASPAWWRPISDPDLWWILWLGERTLDGHLPRANELSWVAADVPWTPHETLIGVVYAAAGLTWVGTLRGLVVSATAVLVAHLAWRERSAWVGAFLAAWTMALVTYGRTERALSWGNLFLATVVALVAGKDRAPWRLPVAAVVVGLWASAHGSFVLGVLIVLIADWRWGLAAAGATLLNPHGLDLWLLVFGYGAGSDVVGLVHAYVPEWTPLDPTGGEGLLAAVGLAGSAVLLLAARDWRGLLTWNIVAILAVQHRRFTDVAAIALLPHLADALAARLPPRPSAWPVPLLLVAMLPFAVVSPRAPVDEAAYPSSLDLSALPGRHPWNDFRLGGWLGRTGVPVFWDPRNDCYPVDVFADGVAIERQEAGWSEGFDHRGFDAAVTALPDLQRHLSERGWVLASRAGATEVWLCPDCP